jgi:hypothetical protein
MSTTDALLALREPLERLGFRKRAGQIYTVDLGNEVLGWVGLNKASRHRQAGQVEVNPVVGVRHQPVERVVADLLGQKFHDYQPPTVSSPIGYLMPERKYAAWVIGEGSSPGAPEDLASAVAEIALPWMQSLRALPQLRQALEEQMGHQPEYRLPVVLALVGEHAEAGEAVKRTLAQLGTRADAAADLFRKFAESFDDWESLPR